jgi:hypothetical protein
LAVNRAPVKFNQQTLRDAYEAAIKAPIPFPEGTPKRPSSKIDVLYSMSWYLAEQAAPYAFLLPRRRIAKLLDTTAMTVSNCVKWLTLPSVDVICCTDERYSFKNKRRCKQYRLGSREDNRLYIRTKVTEGLRTGPAKEFHLPDDEEAVSADVLR